MSSPQHTAGTTVPVTGPSGGAVKERLNIKDVIKHDKFWTLYIRALLEMQGRRQDDPKSYFQLAGIHGFPFNEWAKPDGSKGTALNETGYCTHSQILFPTWHRIYVSAFEQILQEAALAVAEKFTADQSKWKEAAQDLRQPYWDWANDMNKYKVIQKLFVEEKIDIFDYDGKTTQVDNPLLRYNFESIHPDFKKETRYKRLSSWMKTVRNPNNEGEEDKAGLLKKFKTEAAETRQKTLMMLIDSTVEKEHRWELFSNNATPMDGDLPMSRFHANSLEAVHDDIHMFVGQGHPVGDDEYVRGHMTRLGFAAFDPIFWLHHSNVDRLFALWQKLNPDVWVSEGKTRETTMVMDVEATINAETPLEPFYKADGKAWLSNDLKDTRDLFYTYPDITEIESKKKNSREYVLELYGFKTKRDDGPALRHFAEFFGPRKGLGGRFEMYSWFINATFLKYEDDDSFSLVFYFADGGGDWDDKKNFIGSVNAFHGLTPNTCTNCEKNKGVLQSGVVPLSYFIARDHKSSTLESFKPAEAFGVEAVQQYLKDRKFSCKLEGITSFDRLQSLKVSIIGVPLVMEPGARVRTFDTTKKSHTLKASPSEIMLSLTK